MEAGFWQAAALEEVEDPLEAVDSPAAEAPYSAAASSAVEASEAAGAASIATS